MTIGDKLSEEEFPYVICFDSLPTHESDKLPTVKTSNNPTVVGDEVFIHLDVLKSHLKNHQFYNHYTLPIFYAKAQRQVGNSCGYHAI